MANPRPTTPETKAQLFQIERVQTRRPACLCSLSPDLVAVINETGQVILFDIAQKTQKVLEEKKGEPKIYGITAMPDGSLITASDTQLTKYSINAIKARMKGKEPKEKEVLLTSWTKQKPFDLKCSQDGEKIALAFENGEVKELESKSMFGNMLTSVKSFEYPISLHYDVNNFLICARLTGKEVAKGVTGWSARPEIKPFVSDIAPAHISQFNLTILPSVQLAVANREKNAIQIWDLNDGQSRIVVTDKPVITLGSDLAGNLVSVNSDGIVTVYDSDKNNESLIEFKIHLQNPSVICCDRQNDFIFMNPEGQFEKINNPIKKILGVIDEFFSKGRQRMPRELPEIVHGFLTGQSPNKQRLKSEEKLHPDSAAGSGPDNPGSDTNSPGLGSRQKT